MPVIVNTSLHVFQWQLFTIIPVFWQSLFQTTHTNKHVVLLVYIAHNKDTTILTFNCTVNILWSELL